MVWMSASPPKILKFMVSGVGALGMWLDHKCGVLINEISALIRETPENSLTHLFFHGRKQWEVCKLEDSPIQPHWNPEVRLPASRTMTNKFLLLISHPVCGVFVSAQTNWDNFIYFLIFSILKNTNVSWIKQSFRQNYLLHFFSKQWWWPFESFLGKSLSAKLPKLFLMP